MSSYRNIAHASVGSYTVLIQMIMNGSIGLYEIAVMASFYVLSQGLHAQIQKSHNDGLGVKYVPPTVQKQANLLGNDHACWHKLHH